MHTTNAFDRAQLAAILTDPAVFRLGLLAAAVSTAVLSVAALL
ncbi:hypothetical protein [Actinoplanes sp. NPDC051859]